MLPQFYLLSRKSYVHKLMYIGDTPTACCPKCETWIELRNNMNDVYFDNMEQEAIDYLQYVGWDTFRAKFRGKCQYDYYTCTKAIIANQKFFSALLEINATGYSQKDIEFLGWYNQNGTKLLDLNADGYYEMAVSGRCGYLHYLDGREIEKCPICGIANDDMLSNVNGLCVNPQMWDGSDICFYNNWVGAPLVITERVKDILIKRKINNIELIRLDEFRF